MLVMLEMLVFLFIGFIHLRISVYDIVGRV
jgi:hypothetical protein